MSTKTHEDIVKESVTQCLDYLRRGRTIPSRGGQKDYAPDGSWLQDKKIESFYKDRNHILSEERVRIRESLSTAEWDPTIKKARVISKVGKWWKTLGYHEDGVEWLLPEEAMYLMDEGHLEVYYNKLPLTIEDAYATILSSNIPLENYTVYAHLNRYGYILTIYDGPMNITAYEIKIGLHKIKNKKGKKRKLSINDADNSTQKQTCNNASVLDSKSSSDVQPSPPDTQNNEREQNLAVCIDALPRKSTDLPQRPPQPYKTATLYTKYDYDEIMFPHIPPTIAGEVHLPAASATLLPPGIPSKSSSYTPISRAGYSYALDYSYGLKKPSQAAAKNWGEYKYMQKNDQSLLMQSPVGHLWSGDITPLVHPLDATCTDSIQNKLRIIRNSPEQNLSKSVQHMKLPLRVSYNVYKPDKNFQKTAPGIPLARLCIIRSTDAVPDLATLTSLNQQCADGVPLKFAVVDNGTVSFYGFHFVDIPIQRSPLE